MKDVVSRFSEVERRVRAMVEENRALRERVRELERERVTIGAEARDAAVLREKTAAVRARLQRLLARLESLEQEGLPGRAAEEPRAESAGDGHE